MRKRRPRILFVVTDMLHRVEYFRIVECLLRRLSVSCEIILLPSKSSEDDVASRLASRCGLPVAEASFKMRRGFSCLLAVRVIAEWLRLVVRGEAGVARRRMLSMSLVKASLAAAVPIKSARATIALAIKLNHCPEIYIAARSCNLPIYAMQHGDYYHRSSKLTRLHERFCDDVLVWDEAAAQVCRQLEHRQKNFPVMGCLWTLKYMDAVPRVLPRTVVFYESSGNSDLIADLVESVRAELPWATVYVKPHGYLLKKKVSVVNLKNIQVAPVDLSLWVNVPVVAVSMGSTVTQEMVYLGVPVIHISPEGGDSIGRVPKLGFYAEHDKGGVVDEIVKLLCDAESRAKFSAKQKREFDMGSWMEVDPACQIMKLIGCG